MLLVVGGVTIWFMVSNTLADEKITVADDASGLAGEPVDGPCTALCQADVIQKHALESTGGKTYAELDRDDPARDTAMRAPFLRASLFTSVVAFGVAGMAVLLGIVFILIGLGMRDVGEKAGELKSQHRRRIQTPGTHRT